MSTKPDTVLIVDDTLENLRVLGEMLELDGHEVRIASQGAQALEMVKMAPPDLILLDVMMPGMDGYEVCRQLKANPGTAAIPVIFLTALTDGPDEALGLELGAVDYISKPFKMDLVRRRIHNHLALRQLQQSLEETVDARTRELEATNEELVRLASTKGRFLKLVSREVGVSANGIIGIAQLALNSIDDAAKRKRFQGLLDDLSGRLATIFEQYEKLAGLQEPGSQGFHPVRLEETVTSVTGGATPIPARSYIVSGDEGLLSAVLTSVFRLLGGVAPAETPVTVAYDEDAVEVILTLSTSAGLAPTASLDLTLASIVLEGLGGSVEATPTPDAGWRVRLRLPQYRP